MGQIVFPLLPSSICLHTVTIHETRDHPREHTGGDGESERPVESRGTVDRAGGSGGGAGEINTSEQDYAFTSV